MNTPDNRQPEQKPAVPKLAFSMREAAESIGVSYITMHRMLARGLIKSSNALRTKIIARTEIERFLKESAQ
jgi:hypothetical protein